MSLPSIQKMHRTVEHRPLNWYVRICNCCNKQCETPGGRAYPVDGSSKRVWHCAGCVKAARAVKS